MDMMDAANPLQLIEDYPVAETKTLLKQLKEDLQEAVAGEEASENDHIDLLMCTIDSLEKELAKVKTINQLSKDKQARIIADTCLILQFLQSQQDFGDEFEDEFEDFDEEEEESER